MTFEPLMPRNIAKIAALEKVCFGENAWSESQLSDLIGSENTRFYIACEGKEILGYGSYTQILDEGHINNIAVDQSVRQKGVASAILQEFIKDSEKFGINSFTLEVRESNVPARKLYEKHAFRLAGIRKGYYSDKENACIYWLMLREDGYFN